TGPLEIALHIEIAGPERGLSAAVGRGEGSREVGRLVDAGHTDAPTAGGSLQDDGIADFARDGLGPGHVGDRAEAAGQYRDAGRAHQPAGLDPVPHLSDGLGPRADEGDAGALHGFGEARALGEKAVARMDGVGPGLPGRIEDAFAAEIALAPSRPAD